MKQAGTKNPVFRDGRSRQARRLRSRAIRRAGTARGARSRAERFVHGSLPRHSVRPERSALHRDREPGAEHSRAVARPDGDRGVLGLHRGRKGGDRGEVPRSRGSWKRTGSTPSRSSSRVLRVAGTRAALHARGRCPAARARSRQAGAQGRTPHRRRRRHEGRSDSRTRARAPRPAEAASEEEDRHRSDPASPPACITRRWVATSCSSKPPPLRASGELVLTGQLGGIDERNRLAPPGRTHVRTPRHCTSRKRCSTAMYTSTCRLVPSRRMARVQASRCLLRWCQPCQGARCATISP